MLLYNGDSQVSNVRSVIFTSPSDGFEAEILFNAS
jgi:hypothetical protein